MGEASLLEEVVGAELLLAGWLAVGWSCCRSWSLSVLAVVGLSCLLSLGRGQGLGVVFQIPVPGDPASSPSLSTGVGSVLSRRLCSTLFS